MRTMMRRGGAPETRRSRLGRREGPPGRLRRARARARVEARPSAGAPGAPRCAGEPGKRAPGRLPPVRPDDGESLLALARSLGVDFVVIGPEAPLVAGVADELRSMGVAVFGPGRAAARIEGSKGFAKDV